MVGVGNHKPNRPLAQVKHAWIAIKKIAIRRAMARECQNEEPGSLRKAVSAALVLRPNMSLRWG